MQARRGGRAAVEAGWETVALEVLRRADRAHPADAVLREVLRGTPGLDGDRRARISEAVSAWYRWWGWLEPVGPGAAALGEAIRLNDRYQRSPGTFTDEELLQRAVPVWIWEHLAEDRAWVRHLQRPPRRWLRLRPGAADRVRQGISGLQPGPAGVEGAWFHTGSEDLFRTRLFHEGAFEIQDLSSQLVGQVCAPEPGEHWWDVCAGEGGKTIDLAGRMANRGVVWATDRASWRLARLRVRAARAGWFNCRPVAWDGQGRPGVPRGLRGVLVDAPCSGVGVWQRHPQARWTTPPGEVTELAAVQLRLLTQAARHVAPGGRLVYSVCTLTRGETEEVADRLEASVDGLEPLPVPDPLSPDRVQARHRFRPWDWESNGMFVAVWRRVSGHPR